MSNKLFLICPDCHLEEILKNKYGDNSFFLTALGSVFSFNAGGGSLESLIDFIRAESIKEIYIVKEKSCRFINSILQEETGYRTHAEKVMLNILIDNYFLFMQKPSLNAKRRTMAYLSLRSQVKEMLRHDFFKKELFEERLAIKGLITAKQEMSFTELEFKLEDFGNEFKLTN